MAKTITPGRVKRAIKRNGDEISEAALAAVFDRQQANGGVMNSDLDWRQIDRETTAAEFPQRHSILVTLVVEYDSLADLADGAPELHDNAALYGSVTSMKVSIPGGDYDWKA